MRSWPCSSPARLSINIAYIIYRIEKTEPTQSSVYAPQVGLEPTTTRLTAECSAIELLRNIWIPATSYSPGPCPAKYHRR